MTQSASNTEPWWEMLPVCITSLTGFEKLNARMPTTGECKAHGWPAEVPVFVVTRRGREDLIWRADRTVITIGTEPPPDAEGLREQTRRILHYALEEVSNHLDDIHALAVALGGMPREITALLDTLEERRRQDAEGAEALETLEAMGLA